MASIEPRPSKRTGRTTYRVVWRELGEKQGETLPTEIEAQLFKVRVEAEGNRWPVGWTPGTGFDTPETGTERIARLAGGRDVPTFGEWAETYWESDRHEMQTHTVSRARGVTRGRAALIWDKPIESIATADIQSIFDECRAAGLTVGSIRQTRQYLNGPFVDYSAFNGVSMDNPVKGARIRKVKGEGNPIRFLTTDEFHSIRDQITDPELLLFVDLLANTGLRSGEARALRPRDITFGLSPRVQVARTVRTEYNGTLSYGDPKSQQSKRVVELPPAVAVALKAHIAGLGPDAPVFRFWSRVGYHGALDAWHRATDAAGFEHAPRFHDLRHSHAGWLLAARWSIFEVSRQLGHSTITITANTYGHLDQTNKRGMADSIGAALTRA